MNNPAHDIVTVEMRGLEAALATRALAGSAQAADQQLARRVSSLAKGMTAIQTHEQLRMTTRGPPCSVSVVR